LDILPENLSRRLTSVPPDGVLTGSKNGWTTESKQKDGPGQDRRNEDEHEHTNNGGDESDEAFIDEMETMIECKVVV
jgi:hypothetical protein